MTGRTISRTRFSTEGLSGREGWEVWRNAFAPLFDIREEDEPTRFRAEVDTFEMRMMTVSMFAFDGVQQIGSRSKELIGRSGLDHYAIELCLKSDGYMCEGRNGTTEIADGHIVVLDLSQVNTLNASNSTSLALSIPRAILDRRCPGIEYLHGTRIGGPGLPRLLADHMTSLYRTLPDMTPADADMACEATVALIGACLAPTEERLANAGGIIDHTLLDRAKRYIESRIDDPHLTPAAICTAIGTSRSNLYYLFRHTGGIASYIQERRLRRVHAALRDPAERRSISELAYAYGFTSAAHFSRAFRKLFACTPSDVRDIARKRAMRVPDTTAAETFVEDWLNRLQTR